MHIVLEGIISVELSCVLFHLCSTYECVSVSEINSRINSFWSAINVEKCNKPPELNVMDKPGRLFPSMKAVQSWALLKYLPLIMGDVVLADDPHWIFLLHLSELVDLLFCHIFTHGMITYLRKLIADHLSMFVELYGTGKNSLCSKLNHHLLVHLTTVIRQSGPLVDMNCLRYELKNSFLSGAQTSHVISQMSVKHLHTNTNNTRCIAGYQMKVTGMWWLSLAVVLTLFVTMNVLTPSADTLVLNRLMT